MSGNLAYLGRQKCLIIADVTVIVGSVIMLVPNFASLCIGRFIYGTGIGVYVPKYIVEMAPKEIRGPVGAL